eukprot:TRINITY_DN66852_c2_g5_i1.p1 TRINITY_DN66852_c2_g5~~TRINITY_DN66852_c2_g5_i1.p1  ORF type:complete len:1093 (+),score=518.79 TRINITY_DN66852_c2_g5_i1:455-3280(+)
MASRSPNQARRQRLLSRAERRRTASPRHIGRRLNNEQPPSVARATSVGSGHMTRRTLADTHGYGPSPSFDRATSVDSHDRVHRDRIKRQTLSAEIRLNFEAPPADVSPRFQAQRLQFIQKKLQQLGVDSDNGRSGMRSAPTSPRQGSASPRRHVGSGRRRLSPRSARTGASGKPHRHRRSKSSSHQELSDAASTASSSGSGRDASPSRGHKKRKDPLTPAEHEFLDKQSQATAGFRDMHDDIVLMARNVYSASCEDLGMAPSLSREARFVSVIVDFCRRGEFHMQNRRLGAKSACEIAKFLLHHEMKCIDAFRQHPEAAAMSSAEQYRRFGLVPFTSVDLTGNSLGNKGAGMLAELVRCSRSITSLAIGTNDFTSKGFASIFSAMKQPDVTVRSLDLSSVSSKGSMYLGPGIKGAEALEAMLASCPSLEKLNLHKCGVGLVPQAAKHMSNGLALNRTLTMIDLSSNKLNGFDMEHLCEALLQHGGEECVLRKLYMPDNHIGSFGAACLGELLRTNRSIEEVDVSRNHIGVSGFALLSHYLGLNKSVQRLRVDGNLFGGTPQMSEMLERKDQEAYLSDKEQEQMANKLRERVLAAQMGVKYVSTRFRKNTTLQVLWMCSSDMKAPFAEELCMSLRDNATLRELHLGHNRIGDTGAAGVDALCGLLRRNETLKVIDLVNNRLSDAAGVALCKALAANKTLQEVTLDDNALGADTGAALSKTLPRMPHVVVFGLSGNPMPYALSKKLTEMVATHKRRFDATLLQRQMAEIRRLRQIEVDLYRTNAEIAHCTTLQVEAQRELGVAKQSLEDFHKQQRFLTDQKRAELQAARSGVKDSWNDESFMEEDIRADRTRLESKASYLRQRLHDQRELTKSMQADLENLRAQLKKAKWEINFKFDECGRSEIELQSQVKLRDEAKSELAVELGKLKVFIEELEDKGRNIKK